MINQKNVVMTLIHIPGIRYRLISLTIALTALTNYNASCQISGDTSVLSIEAIYNKLSPFPINSQLNFISPVSFLNATQRNKIDSSVRSQFYQQAGFAFSFTGAYNLAIKTFDSAFLKPGVNTYFTDDKAIDHFPFKELNVSDLLHSVAESMKKKQVIILNEAHHIPAHRLTAYYLLKMLKKQGIDVFAVETLSPFFNNDTTKVLQSFHGYYSNEPTMANLIRFARKLGMKVISYDCSSADCSDVNKREAVAAEYLTGFLKNYPNSKMFIYCGYRHAMKDSIGNFEPLAAKIQRLTGIVPLSLSQTTIYQSTVSFLGKELYNALITKLNPKVPLLIKIDNKAYRPPAQTHLDGLILTPPYENIINRRFLKETDLIIKLVSLKKLGIKKGVLLQLYISDEIEKGLNVETLIPAYQALLTNFSKSVKVVCPSGKYTGVVRDADNRIIYKFNFNM
jgi:hypothetical protein